MRLDLASQKWLFLAKDGIAQENLLNLNYNVSF